MCMSFFCINHLGFNPRYKAVGTATYHCYCVLPSPSIIYTHEEVLVTLLTEKAYNGVEENIFFRQKSQVLKNELTTINSS